MSTQTEKTTHQGNGDKANHFDEAHKKTARDFYVKVEGMSREEARAKVDQLSKAGLLREVAFYVKAIKDEAARQENLHKREEAQKEAQRKADIKNRAKREAFNYYHDHEFDETVEGFEDACAEYEQTHQSERFTNEKFSNYEPKAKTKANKGKVEPEECTLDAMQAAMIKDFIAKGATKITIKGLLKDLFQFNKGQVEYLINELFPESVSAGRGTIFEGNTFKGRFYRRLLEGVMSREQFEEFIAGESENVIKHKSAHDNVRVMSNRIHEKYNV